MSGYIDWTKRRIILSIVRNGICGVCIDGVGITGNNQTSKLETRCKVLQHYNRD